MLRFVNFAYSNNGMVSYMEGRMAIQKFLDEHKITKEQIVSMTTNSFGDDSLSEYCVSLLVDTPEPEVAEAAHENA